MRTAGGNYIIGEDTKTPHGRRSIPVNDYIREILEHQREINRMIDGDKIKSIHETIFKAFARGVLLPFTVDRDIDRICHRIGIERFTFHAFRATFATRCIEQGVEVRTLQELLGHVRNMSSVLSDFDSFPIPMGKNNGMTDQAN
ncbi:MAG: tyrosine-type recombinase/integrase [Lachnospiraceae bacterium]|nr:tyrosine-type recombinase/integrase [Lachnospiraceae bacterium]